MATLTGDSTSQTLTGTTANDTLYGAGGNDTLVGGAGNDLYKYYLGTGNDTIKDLSGTDSLLLDDPSGIFVDWDFYRSADDSDLIISFGSAGTVTIDNQFSNSSSLVINKLMLPDDNGGYMSINLMSGTSGTLGSDIIVGKSTSESLSGGVGDDSIFGGDGNDTLYGGSDNDLLSGGKGNDILYGGDDGNDASYYGESAGIIANMSSTYITNGGKTVASMSVYETAYSTTDKIYQIEDITGTDYNDIFYASSSTPDQDFTGAKGNDTFYSINSGTHYYDGGSGSDTISYTRSTQAVSVSLSPTVDQQIGTSGSDYFDSIENLTGSNYSDILTGDSAANKLYGGSGSDKLIGNSGNDYLDGGSSNDKILGGSGNDTLTGGVGMDSLTGGTGIDYFDFNALSEMTTSGTTTDVITDFVHGTDKIDLSGIDANTSTTTDNAFTTLISSSSSFTTAGQLKYAGGILYGNTNSDNTAEFAIHLTGTPTVTISDFVL